MSKNKIMIMAAQGSLIPVVDSVHALNDVRDALRLLVTEPHFGKVVVSMT